MFQSPPTSSIMFHLRSPKRIHSWHSDHPNAWRKGLFPINKAIKLWWGRLDYALGWVDDLWRKTKLRPAMAIESIQYPERKSNWKIHHLKLIFSLKPPIYNFLLLSNCSLRFPTKTLHLDDIHECPSIQYPLVMENPPIYSCFVLTKTFI